LKKFQRLYPDPFKKGRGEYGRGKGGAERGDRSEGKGQGDGYRRAREMHPHIRGDYRHCTALQFSFSIDVKLSPI
jgi:hypothetical protein